MSGPVCFLLNRCVSNLNVPNPGLPNPDLPDRSTISRRTPIHRALTAILLFILPLALFTSCASVPAHMDQGVVSVADHGAEGDGDTDDTAAFREALAQISETGGELVIPHGVWRVSNITIPTDVTLQFRSGARLYVPEGDSLEIDGSIRAGTARIFDGEGSVTGEVGNERIIPQWFGARGDGEHDDGPALQKAADLAATSMGFTLFIPDGEYRFESDVEIRSNVDNRGLLVKVMEIDEDRTVFSNFTFVHQHYPVTDSRIIFVPDHPEQELIPEPFLGAREGDFRLRNHEGIPLKDGSGRVTLAEGGTIRFYSSDFFSSRNNQKGDQFYDRNDISRIVSGRGDIFPELAFDYNRLPDADEWSPDRHYSKGDFVTYGGEMFKATWESGPGTEFEDRYLGTVPIGPVGPEPGEATTHYEFEFEDGSEDRLSIWREVHTRVWYREQDRPITVNGLRVELRLEGHEGETKRLQAGAVDVNRSNIVFHRPQITVRDPEATVSRLMNLREATNLEFHSGYFSGATYHGLGYNILNFNVADVRFYNTVSINSRKGSDGRHGKNITIQGGHFGVIDDHYGRNYVIRDAVVTGQSTNIPGYVSPDADLQEWHFRTIRPFGFSGANFHVENVVIDGASGGIAGARGDIGDLYGRVVFRDVTVRGNEGDVRLFNHSIDPDFDFAGEVRTPDKLLVENVTLENPGRLNLNIGNGFRGGEYGPVEIRHSGPLGEIFSSSRELSISGCEFRDAEFELPDGSMISIQNCRFMGSATGIRESQIHLFRGNVKELGADVSFPLNYVNPAIWEE